jgi:peptidoglycan/LPS O-acetylase OafA/YrhL
MTRSAVAAFDAFRSTSRFGSLDGLRALSVVAVIWHHTGAGYVAQGWAQQGHLGVSLFFAISGFLITTLLLREKDRHGSVDLRAFYVRRALRIFPLYYAVLALYVVLVFVIERHGQEGREFFSNLPYFLTYTSNWFVALDGRTIFYFSWSLAAEEQFYLVWPPLMKRLGSRARSLAVVAAVLLLLLVASQWSLPALLDAGRDAALRGVFDKVPLAIFAGVAAALLLHERSAFARCWPWLAGSRWHSAGWFAAAVAAALAPAAPWALPQLLFALLVASCCVREDHVLGRFLRLPPLVYMGTISYGLYLLHVLCKNIVVKVAGWAGVAVAQLGSGAFFLATLLLSLVVAGLSFKYFESPFLRMKGRFEPRIAPALRPA